MSAPPVPSASVAASQPVSAANAAASAISRLPDGDSFSLFGEITPDKLPIILKLPDGGQEQVQIPLNSTVNDLKNSISLPRSSNDGLRLSFGKSDLDPSASLLDTNIIDAYEHAGSLLHVIGNGVQDIDTKVAAVNSVCAVVEKLSNGVKNMEELCDAATNPEHHLPQEPAVPNADLPPIPSDPIIPDQLPHSPSATPSALTHSLSRRLPDLFPPGATTAAFPGDATNRNAVNHLGECHPLEAQPSISSIRDARRRWREANDGNASQSAPEITPMNDDIGCSTYARPLPDTFDNRDPSVQKDSFSHGAGTSVMFANSGNTTWLGDLMTAWEVNAIRQSGVLEKSKDGQDVSEYLLGLETGRQEGSQTNENPSGKGPDSYEGEDGDDDDDDEDDGDDNPEPHSAGPMLEALPNNSDHSPNPTNMVQAANNTQPSHPVTSSIPMNPYQPFASNSLPVKQSTTFCPIVSNAISLGSQPAASAPAIVTHPAQSSLSSTPAPSIGHISVPSPSISSASTGSTGNLVRRAAKIAPAPTTVQPGTGNGMIPVQIFQGCPPIHSNWPQPIPVVTGKKKRGRKRKNPQLSEEERALYRKEQNRESARLSRVRRKVIAIEYEDKLKTLVDENASLRKQVDGLNNRLAYLQSILTVTVTRETQARET